MTNTVQIGRLVSSNYLFDPFSFNFEEIYLIWVLWSTFLIPNIFIALLRSRPPLETMAQITRLVTGGLVDHITHELIVAADDPDESTKALIRESLLETGKKKPIMTMSTIMWTISNKVC